MDRPGNVRADFLDDALGDQGGLHFPIPWDQFKNGEEGFRFIHQFLQGAYQARISDALAALAKGESLSEVFDRLRAPPEKTVAFAIAVIALGAKMAKADGVVTRKEARRIERKQDRASRNIARKKHNNRKRPRAR